MPTAEALGALVVASMINGALALSPALKVTIWVSAGFLVIQSLWAVATWMTLYLVVTSERVLISRGFGRVTVEMTPLENLKDLVLERSFAGRLFGYGTFSIATGARRQELFDYVPYPEQIYLLTCGMLFPSSAPYMDESYEIAIDPDEL